MLSKIKKWFESGALIGVLTAVLALAFVILGMGTLHMDPAEYSEASDRIVNLSGGWTVSSETVAEYVIPESVPENSMLRFESYFNAARIYLDGKLILDAPYNEETSCVYTYWRALDGCCGKVLRLEAESSKSLAVMTEGDSSLGSPALVFRQFVLDYMYASVYFVFSVAASIFIGFMLMGLARGSTLSNNHVIFLLLYILLSATCVLTDSQLLSALGLSSDFISYLNVLSTGLMAPAIFHFVMNFYNRYNKRVRTYILIIDSLVLLNLAAGVLFGLPLFRFLLLFHAIMVFSIMIATGVIFKELRFNPTKENRLFAAAVIALIIGSGSSIACYYFGPPRSYNIMFAATMLVFVSLLTVIVFRTMQVRINASEVERRRALALAKDNAESIGKAKTALVRSISYGIRMPMNSVQGYLTLARAHLDEPEYLEDCLGKADEAGHQVIELLDEMLNVYRTESGQLEIREESIDIVRAFRDITSDITDKRQDSSIHCSFDVSFVTNRFVIMDRAYFAGIIRTLLNNAFKHTGPGGTIYCELKQESSPNIGYSGFSLTVSDNGEGMSHEELELINNDSDQSPESIVTNAWNTSMLLFVYKRILRTLGGMMYIDSDPSEGTTITVSLDLKNSDNAASSGAPRLPLKDYDGYSAKGKRVLVVDDNEQSLDIISSLLKDMEIEVETATDGSLAVELIRNSPANHFDLVLMDIVMPYMDGHRAASLIRSLGSRAKASVPIVGMSADIFDASNSSVGGSGIQEMLFKPVGMNDLYKVMAKYAPEKKKR